MGSGCSKDTVGVVKSSCSSSSSSSSERGRSWSRSFGRRFCGSACLGLPQVLSDEKNEEENGRVKESACKEAQDSEHLKFAQTGALSLPNSNFRTDEGNQENAPRTDADTPITSAPSRSHSRSRFGFFPDGIGFRLGRAASLGSSNANIVFSRSFSIPQAGEDHQMERRNDGSSDNRSRSYQDSLIDANSAQDGGTHNSRPNSETRRAHRRLQESTEGTARFSRTLSVGRLRDRVLRRTSLPEGRFGSTLSEEGSVGHIRQGSGRRYLSGLSNIYSTMSDEMPPTSGSNNSRNLDSSHDNEAATPQPRESSTQDSLEHRSAFLERRRRIRSQVRALQRLGSRFENLSGHDRSCILSGQHRTGRCACRANTRSANSGDDASTRASISRIVMLAEALFEVLDEIHQQAVVLASRPSISSIGSVPAPKEVVDSMPVKIYTKTQKQQNDDAAQCHICLVEYEDGDCMRVLPCHHKFHRTCVDKWLKEIHRVCPLCRGDICISDASPVDELD